jgi:hypothetical protein
MRLPISIRLLCCAVFALPASAQQLLTTFTGSVGDEYGAAVRVVFDQNGDGFQDVVIGAPGYNSDRGYIRCISGQYLKNGTGPVLLWSLFPGVAQSARFGTQILEVSSLTGDSTRDLLVSAPGVHGAGTTLVAGAIVLVDGSTHQIATYIYGSSNSRLGTSIADCGDQDGDGKPEIAATAPTTNGSPSWVNIINGTAWGLSNNLAVVPHISLNSNSSNVWADVVASGFDLDGDGRKDLAIGSPRMFTAGNISVIHADSSVLTIGSYSGTFAGELMGSSIDFVPDVDGDAVVDFIFGAPGMHDSFGNEAGRAVVVSGRQMRTWTFPMDIHDLRMGFGSGAFHFGGCVRGGSDLNRDGVADVMIGAPDYFTVLGGFFVQADRGAVMLFSGKTGSRIGFIAGGVNDHLGDALQGGFLDKDNDTFLEFGVCGSLSDNANVDCGNFRIYRLFPSVWSSYCTAKVNSQGCTPSMSGSGTLSATAGTTFPVMCSNVLNQVNGLLMYGHAPIATPFQGGTLCVNTPLTRTAVQLSGGSTSGVDCTGLFSMDFAARVHSGIDPTLVVGAEVFFQYWSRDSASLSTTNLSNAVRSVINP